MSPLLQHAIAFTLGCYAVASLMVLVRLVRGPRAQDRVFALDLFVRDFAAGGAHGVAQDRLFAPGHSTHLLLPGAHKGARF